MSWALRDKKGIYQTETLGKGRGNTTYKELKEQQCTNHSWAGKGLCSHTGEPTLEAAHGWITDVLGHCFPQLSGAPGAQRVQRLW